MQRDFRRCSVGVVLTLCLGLQVVGAGPSHAATPVVDANTSTIEAAIGHWQPWFSTTVARSAEQAHSGTRSLEVDITAPDGWGVQWDNWPGFPVGPSTNLVSFWARSGAGSGLRATMSVDWRQASGQVLRTDTLESSTLTTTWQRTWAVVIAPPGTTSVTVEVTNASGVAGNSLYLDDIVVSTLPSVLDWDTSTLEDSLGHWESWISTAISRAPVANGGNFGLQVDITGSGQWAIRTDNEATGPDQPGPIGFFSGQGPFAIGFSALASREGLGAEMQIMYWNGSHNLGGDAVSLTNLSPYGWQHASKEILSTPNGTSSITLRFMQPSGSGGGAPGDIIYLDDVVVGRL